MLEGAQENPPTGSATTGCGRVDFNPATNTLSYSIMHGAFTSGTLFAHIHRGVVGQNGGIVFTLGPGPTSWAGTTGALTPTDLADLFKGNLYVNVHSNAFSAGEIRARSAPTLRLRTVGNGAWNPGIDASGYAARPPRRGDTVTNAVPGTAVLLFIGTSTTFAPILAAPLPHFLLPLGVLWMDADPGLHSQVADSTGCAEVVPRRPTRRDCSRASQSPR